MWAIPLGINKICLSRICHQKKWIYLYAINQAKKYLFGFIVAAYLVSVFGIPVYFHYCGGELATVNILIKGDGCCGDDEGTDQDGCCKDENTVIANASDFTIKNLTNYKLLKVCCDIPTCSLQYSVHQVILNKELNSNFMESPPPGNNINPVIATTVILV